MTNRWPHTAKCRTEEVTYGQGKQFNKFFGIVKALNSNTFKTVKHSPNSRKEYKAEHSLHAPTQDNYSRRRMQQVVRAASWYTTSRVTTSRRNKSTCSAEHPQIVYLTRLRIIYVITLSNSIYNVTERGRRNLPARNWKRDANLPPKSRKAWITNILSRLIKQKHDLYDDFINREVCVSWLSLQHFVIS